MSTLKHYFQYVTLCGGCGIPRVTLEGERSDWVDILGRIEKLKEYGVETTAAANVDFWQRVAQHDGGSGSDFYSGWITAFTVFSKEGDWLGPFISTNVASATEPGTLTAAQFWATYAKTDEQGRTDLTPPHERLVLDHTPYHRLPCGSVPPGYAEVNLKIVDYDVTPPVERNCAMVAGTVGIRVTSSGDRTLSASGVDDTVQPVVGWWLFTCVTDEEQEKRMRKGGRMVFRT
ncbi:hypothetical protein FB45DRAFT_1032315 [Roridomyces roridus]|uniref:Uncharacterized protein n=1 Tax=Roridomyces roridus TaxID=1738132 RepID=A0AAD7BHA7_9AGAR|nr:hypothetical protein FB45DRAFT_1032315 [Roridomyces roridus]